MLWDDVSKFIALSMIWEITTTLKKIDFNCYSSFPCSAMTPTSVLPTHVVLGLPAQTKWVGTLASARLGPLGLTHMERDVPEIRRP